MVKITLDGVEYECESGLATAVQSALKTAKTDSEKKAQEHKDSADSLTTDNEKLKAKNDELTEENKKISEKKLDDKEIHKLATERSALVVSATKVLDKDTKFDEMSNADIRKAVVAKSCPDLKLDEKTEVYIEARFDGIVETLKETKNDNNADLKIALGNKVTNKDGKELTAEEIRTNNMKTDSEAYLKPLGFTGT